MDSKEVSSQVCGIISFLSTPRERNPPAVTTRAWREEDQLRGVGKKTEAEFSVVQQNQAWLGAWELIWVPSISHVGCVTLDVLTSPPLVSSHKSNHPTSGDNKSV